MKIIESYGKLRDDRSFDRYFWQEQGPNKTWRSEIKYKVFFMKKMLVLSVIVLLLYGVTFFACSNNKETESKKGKIETMTDKTAKELVDRIRTPIEKARAVKNQQEHRSNDIEKALKEQ